MFEIKKIEPCRKSDIKYVVFIKCDDVWKTTGSGFNYREVAEDMAESWIERGFESKVCEAGLIIHKICDERDEILAEDMHDRHAQEYNEE